MSAIDPIELLELYTAFLYEAGVLEKDQYNDLKALLRKPNYYGQEIKFIIKEIEDGGKES